MSPTGAEYKALHSCGTTLIYSVMPTDDCSVLLLLSLLTLLFSVVGSELVQKLHGGRQSSPAGDKETTQKIKLKLSTGVDLFLLSEQQDHGCSAGI